jgi:hypothetical protein
MFSTSAFGTSGQGRLSFTPAQRSALELAAQANRKGFGLYGPSLHRSGPEPTCEDLVQRGLLERRDGQDKVKRGYWLTDAGRQVLNG